MRKTQKLIAGILALATVATLSMTPAQAAKKNSGSNKSTSAAQVLSQLTDQQQNALEALTKESLSGLFLDEHVDLNSADTVSVIVEFKHKPKKAAVLDAAVKGKALSDSEAEALAEADHSAFQKELDTLLGEAQGAYRVTREYHTVLNGVALEVPANQLKALSKLDCVQAVFSNGMMTVAPPTEDEAAEFAASVSAGQGMENERKFLNIDKLHAEGITGKGVKVAVIDTGIDYEHPDLKDAYKGGYDFVDEDDDPMETTWDDWRASRLPEMNGTGHTYYTNHGTHVSGTIAGQGKNDSRYATKGLAPDADLYVYRVLGPYGSGYSDDILAGIEEAVNQDMDVINLSLGANYNYPYYVTSIAINNAVLNGVTAVVSAGNSGDGMYTLGSPGSAALALTVGASSVPQQTPILTGSIGEAEMEIRGLTKGWEDDFETFAGTALEIVNVPGYGALMDYSGLDVKGKVALVQRGNGITLYDKVIAASRNGAAAVIIWNNNPDEGFIPAYMGELPMSIPAFNITNEAGLAIQAALEAGETTFTWGEEVTYATPYGGDILAPFSSRGPSRVNYDVKPEIVAPGVGMLSTTPGYLRDKDHYDDVVDYEIAYERMDGTSMAAPFVSGVSALLLQAKPELTPADVKAVLMNTADPLNGDYSVFEQGAGRVDPYEAVHTDMEIKVSDDSTTLVNDKERKIKDETGGISFGNVFVNGKDFKGTKKVLFTNSGKENKTFDVSVVYQNGLRGSLDAEANGVTIQTDATLKVKKNHTANTKITLNVPGTAQPGIYEGYVVYTNQKDSGESYRVPFAIHYVEEGIEDYALVYDKTTTAENHLTVLKFDPTLLATFTLKSHVSELYQIVMDENGKELGITGAYDGFLIQEGVTYTIGFDGTYYPFTGNAEQPYDTHKRILPQGHYQLKLIGITDEGKTLTTNTVEAVIDNTAPSLFEAHMDGEIPGSPFIEYPVGTEKIHFTAKLTDDGIPGQDVDQSLNNLFFYYNSSFPSGRFELQADGSCQGEIPISPKIDVTDFELEGVDQAGVTAGRKYFFLVSEETPYVYTTDDNKEMRYDSIYLKEGEEATYTVHAYNAKELRKANYTFRTRSTDTIVDSIVLTPEAEAAGVVATINSEDKYGSGDVQHTIDIVFPEDKYPEGFNGDMDMLKIHVHIPEDLASCELSSSMTNAVQAKFFHVGDGNYPSDRPYCWTTPTGIMPDFSEVYGQFYPESLINNIGLLPNLDFAGFGAKVSVVGPDGTVYEGMNREYRGRVYGTFVVPSLPVSGETFTLVQDIPGHFTTYNEIVGLSRVLDGQVYGNMKSVQPNVDIDVATAGDVNKDDVIDLYDAMAIQAAYGATSGDEAYDRNADINWDGVIDEADFAFVEWNYETQNPSVPNAPKPVTKVKGKTLTDVKNQLG